MSSIEAAMERIRQLECPTGEIENRVAIILEAYGVSDRQDIEINRNEQCDRDGAKAYQIEFARHNATPFIILAKSGLDDYVAKVIDAYVC